MRRYYFTEDDRFNPPDPVELTPEDDFTETMELNLDAVTSNLSLSNIAMKAVLSPAISLTERLLII